jgi:hydroxymethylpyrimidine/phosphomethylpyrimidine kinase
MAVAAAKTGMLANAGIVAAVAAAVERHRFPFLVVDPVMVAKSGDRLLAPDAVDHLRHALLPMVDLVTPNLPEAADLLGVPEATDDETMSEQARALGDTGVAVLLKGGHLRGPESTDLFLDRAAPAPVPLYAPRVATKSDHGTGCTLSSAIACLRPRHDDWLSAIVAAKQDLTDALIAATRLDVGRGHGPVHHFHAWW